MAFFPSLKQNFIAYPSSSRPDCIFEIHQLWQSGFSRMYSNCYFSCSFEREIIKIGQSTDKMYSNNILNFQVSTTILNACTKKKSENLLNLPRIYHQQVALTLEKVRSRQEPARIITDADYTDDIVLMVNTPAHTESLPHCLEWHRLTWEHSQSRVHEL